MNGEDELEPRGRLPHLNVSQQQQQVPSPLSALSPTTRLRSPSPKRKMLETEPLLPYRRDHQTAQVARRKGWYIRGRLPLMFLLLVVFGLVMNGWMWISSSTSVSMRPQYDGGHKVPHAAVSSKSSDDDVRDSNVAQQPPLSSQSFTSDSIIVGVGKADATAAIGGVNMLGYADPDQHANGIHLRIYARAFVFINPATSSSPSSRRTAFISVDIGFLQPKTKQLALEYLHTLFQNQTNAEMPYTTENVMVSATHSHSAPGGFADDMLYQVTSFGTVPGQREAVAKGIANAIYRAHMDAEKHARSSWVAEGDLTGASINRSPEAYLMNPVEERDRYDTNVDTNMVVVSVPQKGLLSWFAVHGTSMNKSSQYVSGDNKGFSSYLLEKEMGPDSVAIFAQANSGDVSPNTGGSRCLDTGLSCNASRDSCKGNPILCVARGPGFDDGKNEFHSTRVIGTLQAEKAKEIYTSPSDTAVRRIPLSGPISFAHIWIDMSNMHLTFPETDFPVRTCKPAMGRSFAAGTTDGPGLPMTYQGDNEPHSEDWMHRVWNGVRSVLASTSKEDVACQYPKPILINTGRMRWPYRWQPEIVPIQIAVVGRQLVIINMPGEVTTMAGRRLRDTARAALLKQGLIQPEAKLVIAGLSNAYASYITTYQEYQKQRYEGASTIYGPHTLLAYQTTIEHLATSLGSSNLPATKSSKTWLSTHATHAPLQPVQEVSWLSRALVDVQAPWSLAFGTPVGPIRITTDKHVTTVSAHFSCAHPRSGAGRWTRGVTANATVEGVRNIAGGVAASEDLSETFMVVERLIEDATGVWKVVFTDAEWDTRFLWTPASSWAFGSNGLCKTEWDILGGVEDAKAGVYRFRIFGVAQTMLGGTKEYTGVSSEFVI